ncbi:uncharacterized protein LOC122263573 [Penaeus japonicus]|uniref:uncharacterized protein LOC122263573 n=1 Tax=Penaeus japonicus TaxID=27405 RepID=UPI001C70F533|nr:uncharacterized protein LOC122263573 [Penaeus japonicus]
MLSSQVSGQVTACILLGLLMTCFDPGSCVCYFSLEYQGVYATQSIISGGSTIQYLEVAIEADSIPIWGNCHRRLGNNVILYDTTGGTDCVRCFHLQFRSRHILEVHNEGLQKCYTNEDAALQTCPTLEDIRNRQTREIMLYKTATIEGQALDPVYCPLNGRFRMTYNINDGRESATECPEPTSTLANCPRGNAFTMDLHRCSFGDFSKSYECLGDWEGTDGQRYLALHDPTALAAADADPPPPRFRCAMYKIEEGTGSIFLSLSYDSTCINKLHSAWEGYETLVLTPTAPKPPAAEATAAKCQYPDWAQGQWENLKVEGNQLTYTDLISYKTYRAYCLEEEIAGLIPVYTQSQCGDEAFTCLAMQERSSNVMEFQISPDVKEQYVSGLCSSPASLTWDAWVTQGRVDRFKQSPCPVAGEYTGVIPDAPILCAKLYSDCNNPEIMFYTVFSCYNRSEVIEEREYRCLGQWSETTVTYTYTERRDQAGYECFAGVVVSDGEIYIMEAGVNCQRGLEALSFGMKLVKQAPCLNDAAMAPRPYTPPPTHTPWWNGTRNPWTKKASSTTPKPAWKDSPKGGVSPRAPTPVLVTVGVLLVLLACGRVRA